MKKWGYLVVIALALLATVLLISRRRPPKGEETIPVVHMPDKRGG